MTETYFNLRYLFGRDNVLRAISDAVAPGQPPGYICVADGVVLDVANRHADYLRTVSGALFCVCDSSYVPLYLRWLYGIRREQYSGSQLMMDLVTSPRGYRMMFMGASARTLAGLRERLSRVNPAVAQMKFVELPFLPVEEFDYASIGSMVGEDDPDVIFVALGAPKQEQFMERLRPWLRRGVAIAVGAAFKFHSGTEVKRAPAWMVRCHLEFVHRIAHEPRKQLWRCGAIVMSLPRLLYREWRHGRAACAPCEKGGES